MRSSARCATHSCGANRRLAEERYRSLFADAPFGVFSTTPDGEMLEANPAFVGMLGFADAEELKRINIETLWVDPRERARLHALIHREGLAWNFEMQLRRRDGTAIWCSESSRAVYRPASAVARYENVCFEITGRKRVQQELERSNEELRNFVSATTDQMREALGAVTGSSNLLAERCRGALDGNVNEYISRLLDGVTRMEQLIASLLMRSRAGKARDAGFAAS